MIICKHRQCLCCPSSLELLVSDIVYCEYIDNQHDDSNSSETFPALPGLNTPAHDVFAGKELVAERRKLMILKMICRSQRRQTTYLCSPDALRRLESIGCGFISVGGNN